ncbi:hypothetical protein, partial [Escherichia coli]|uniref:hypothetical protein n=1 Tax=Escherichia coli TaxID=562 RepID=UPI0028DF4A2F
TYDRFEARVQELAARGRNGIGTARVVLADRGYRDGWAFEKAMRALFRAARFPDPVPQFRVILPCRRYRVDWCFSEEMVGVECD